MRLQFIICKVMQKEAYFCAARSKNVIDIVLMRQGLHNEPNRLRDEVQKALERTSDIQDRPYDATLLGYGLCSNGIVGLSAKIPLVVPRGHDCITLLLGSRHKYRQYFDSHRGVYWYSPGWLETGTQPGKEYFDRIMKEYVEKYGADNAEYLVQTHKGWLKEYQWAVYIDWGFPNADAEKAYTKRCAEVLGWNYDKLNGDPALMQRLLDGDWTEDDFLIVQPGRKIGEDLTSQGLICAE